MATCVLIGNELAISELGSMLSQLEHEVILLGAEEAIARIGYTLEAGKKINLVVFYSTSNFVGMDVPKRIVHLKSRFRQLKILAFRNGEGSQPTKELFEDMGATLLEEHTQVRVAKAAFALHKVLIDQPRKKVTDINLGRYLPLCSSGYGTSDKVKPILPGFSGFNQGEAIMGHAQSEKPACLVIGHPQYIGNLIGQLIAINKKFGFLPVPIVSPDPDSLEEKLSNLGNPFAFVLQIDPFKEQWKEAIGALRGIYENIPIVAIRYGNKGDAGPQVAELIAAGAYKALVSPVGPFNGAISEYLNSLPTSNFPLLGSPVGGLPTPPASFPFVAPNGAERPSPGEAPGREEGIKPPTTVARPEDAVGEEVPQPTTPAAADKAAQSTVSLKEVMAPLQELAMPMATVILLRALATGLEAASQAIRIELAKASPSQSAEVRKKESAGKSTPDGAALAVPTSTGPVWPGQRLSSGGELIVKPADNKRCKTVLLGPYEFEVTAAVAHMLEALAPSAAPCGLTKEELAKKLGIQVASLSVSLGKARGTLDDYKDGFGALIECFGPRSNKKYRLNIPTTKS